MGSDPNFSSGEDVMVMRDRVMAKNWEDALQFWNHMRKISEETRDELLLLQSDKNMKLIDETGKNLLPEFIEMYDKSVLELQERVLHAEHQINYWRGG
jgi:hypothetical protein